MLVIIISLIVNFFIISYIERAFNLRRNINKYSKSTMNKYPFKKLINIYNRNKSIRTTYATTDFIDTMILNLQAGSHIFNSFERSTFTITDPILKLKCIKVLRKYYLGSSFMEAMRDSIKENPSSSYNEVIENIMLSLKLGSSLSENLTLLSYNMKTTTNTELEELASQASVKMIFPLVFFIFPVIFILLGSASIEDLIISFAY